MEKEVPRAQLSFHDLELLNSSVPHTGHFRNQEMKTTKVLLLVTPCAEDQSAGRAVQEFQLTHAFLPLIK